MHMEYSNSGQICTVASKSFCGERSVEIKSSKIGDSFDSETFQGSKIDKMQYERVLN